MASTSNQSAVPQGQRSSQAAAAESHQKQPKNDALDSSEYTLSKQQDDDDWDRLLKTVVRVCVDPAKTRLDADDYTQLCESSATRKERQDWERFVSDNKNEIRKTLKLIGIDIKQSTTPSIPEPHLNDQPSDIRPRSRIPLLYPVKR
ncbi:hypothetical protein JCM5353_006254 [Sporobolomyces roseus]